jgi:alcohol dehydrogenase (cytochrome c)
MAPLAWNGMVFAGNAGGDNFAVTGRIYALSTADGHQLWRFNVVPDSGPARATWKNLSDRNPPTGGATWTSYSLDPEAGVLWVSTGNVAPDFLLSLHPGDNLYTTSVIALDAKTGTLLRYVQPVKNDYHDWDIPSPPALIRTKGGRQIAAAAGKDGLLYGIDRSGVTPANKSSQAQLKIDYATPVTTRANVTVPFNAKTETHFCPGTQGGTEWNGPAFHPQLNLLLVNSVDWCASVKIADAATITGKRGSIWPGSGDPEHPFGRTDYTVSGDSQRRSFGVLKKGGILVALTEEPSQELAREKGVRATMIGVKPDGRRLADIGKFIDDGKLRPLVQVVFP